MSKLIFNGIRKFTYIWCFLIASCSYDPIMEVDRISNLNYHDVKSAFLEKEIEVSVEDVIAKYESYLEVSKKNSSISVAAVQRVASLRMQTQEAILLSFNEEEDEEIDEEQLKASIKEYESLIKIDPYGVGKDDIYYQMAKAYGLLGDFENQQSALSQLVSNYPDSSFFIDSAFKLGDSLYAQGQYVRAEDAFSKVVDKGRSDENKFYLNSAYMKAWSQFKQSQYDEALSSFAFVIDEGFPTEEIALNASGIESEILKDSLFTMGVIFSYQGEWNDIGLFFDDYGDRYYEYMIYDKLADFYHEQKFYESAASTLASYVDRYPNSDHSPGFYDKAIGIFDTAGYPLRKREYEKTFIEKFGIDSEFWELHPELRDSVKVSLAKYSMDLAKFNHGMAQQSKKPAEKKERYESAMKWYDVYTRTYPDAENAAEANFLLAEIAYELGDYTSARDHYKEVAFGYEGNTFAEDAAYALILTYQKYRPEDSEEASLWRQEGAQDSLQFIATYPDHPDRGRILVSTSEMYFKDENYEEAFKVAQKALESKDTLEPKYQYGAALVMANSAYELERYVEAEVALKEAMSYSKIDRKTKKDLQEKLIASIYKQGEAAKNNGDFKAAAESWKRIGEIAPGSKNAISAEFDGATILLEAEDYDGAIAAYKAFEAKYPNDPNSKTIPEKLIFAYEQKEDWNSAAKLLSEVCFSKDKTLDKERKRISCFQAAENFEKAKNIERATYLYKFYAHSYPKPFELSVEAHSKLNKLYKEDGQQDKRQYWLEKVIELNANAKEPTERSKYLAADALYELGEMARAKYETIELTLPLNESIPVKNEAMQEAQALYTESVEQGVLDYTTSSTYRIGQLYSQLGSALMNSEVPPELDELEAEEYQFLLEDQAYPIEQAAIEIHQTNINRTYDGVYDEWVKRSFDELGRLLPTQYRKKERSVTYAAEIR